VTVTIRPASRDDADALVPLIELLGHVITVDGVRGRIEALAALGCPQFVAVAGDRIVGLCGLHLMTAIHREKPVGRITILVTAETHRGQGIGKMLLRAAEEALAKLGCGLIEVTSNDRLEAAHRFYEQSGYRRTSKRFAKTIS
jgi:GNAT superfamily N-acetyltransferase